jgi:MoaA/NifB/PqqE/SkfB family radical SAM enzyme
MKQRGYLLATLVGGEPYVRPALLERLTPIMPSNWLVTSGTTPLRHLPKTTHFVSVDGADADTHNEVRRSPKLFERILRNLSKARAEGGFPAYAHTVLNALNYRQIEQILAFWAGNGLLDGVVFSTLTPIRGAGDGRLRLTREQREELVAELVRQKERYGDFLVNTGRMIGLLHPDETAVQTPERCGTARLVGSFDASGRRIEQCILGAGADCSQCGCVITTIVDTVYPRPAPGTFKVLARLRTT